MSNNFVTLKSCRISGSSNLVPVLNLGNQALTGVFPKNKDEGITVGPLELVWCPDSGLLQLRHSYDLTEMYGTNYGYRSGLNESMVKHLHNKVAYLNRLCPLVEGDIVLDIGSNDATLLSAYQTNGINRIGIDPTGIKFSQYYTNDIQLIPDFFTAEAYRSKFKDRDAKIITSIAMFYDLESPGDFVADIASILDVEGVWHFEQSYMPTMLRMNAYDTVCHEHLEYYSLHVVKKLVEQYDLKVIDVQMNAVNGGSFAVTVARQESNLKPNSTVIDWLLGQEDRLGLHTPRPYRDFEERVFRHRDDLVRLVRSLRADNKRIVGYGASTKGNVVLQFCGFDNRDIECIAEVNTDKFGSYTPGTHIPILSEAEVRAMQPDYMLVLPWHFRDSIIRREAEYLSSGGRLIFPMPEIEII
ncbi:class I SAM-dependent methyltransferase [Cylindrospermopsis raciborskii]|uniref:class I SAM-dependent methyltransferase n=1 Tax=Cylindrospermopsis raciborskii TaxID=77022 RepID=UPI0008DE61E6|nr:class I SAM-dependent methyltransferase [Cylindrospermopsis raciborskii]NLQ06211.1 class I SAM-dependent methyltransferase [Cylindrospermopsis raciborskii MVCC19]OHY34151.1 methyltransferase [Cylindrospermopsis raciborskii MVCC14]